MTIIRTCLTTALVISSAAALVDSAEARPYPDLVGVCYAYQGDTQTRLEPCVISSGYGAGAHYAVLNWSDGSKTQIVMVNACADENYDESGYCRYTVNDLDAELYERDVFLGVTTLADPDNLPCYRAIATDASFCFRSSER